MTRVVFAPDSFKGSVRADVAARALAEGWRAAAPDVEAVLMPMADGGEGTLDAFLEAVPHSRRIGVTVTAPTGDGVIDASWVLLPPTREAPGGLGVVELAATAGIELLGGRLDPWGASSRGFGEAIVAALDHGVDRLILGIGSSASTDGGAGMLTALGARFETDDGLADARPAARDLRALTGVDLTGLRALPPGGVTVLVDVDNPLLGSRGAAHVFGPQKGFAPGEVAEVDHALLGYAALLPADADAAGAGAAGGVGFGLLVWGARLVPGAPEVARVIGLSAAVAAASAVVTGEGAYDRQSDAGKVPAFVARLAADAGVAVALVAGRVAADADTSLFVASASLTDLAGSAEAALAEPERWLAAAGGVLARERSPGTT